MSSARGSRSVSIVCFAALAALLLAREVNDADGATELHSRLLESGKDFRQHQCRYGPCQVVVAARSNVPPATPALPHCSSRRCEPTTRIFSGLTSPRKSAIRLKASWAGLTLNIPRVSLYLCPRVVATYPDRRRILPCSSGREAPHSPSAARTNPDCGTADGDLVLAAQIAEMSDHALEGLPSS